MKRLVLAAAVVGIVSLGTVPADAHFTYFQASPRGFLGDSNTDVNVRLRYVCSNGETFSGPIRVNQDGHVATGTFEGSCLGYQILTIDTAESGQTFHEGRAGFKAHLTTSDGQQFDYHRIIRLIFD